MLIVEGLVDKSDELRSIATE